MSDEPDNPPASQVLDDFVNATMRIAERGASRADVLDLIATALVVAAVLLIIGTASIGLGASDSLSGGELAGIVAGGAASVAMLLVSAAMVYGFASLVRNSARSLELLALDSSLLDG